MQGILEKISSYNIFNFLLPGTIFAYLSDHFTNTSFIQDDLLIAVFVYYFLGMLISRVGSLLIEPFLKITGFITFSDYVDFLKATRNDPTIYTLSEVNNTLRTMISLLLFVIGTITYNQISSASSTFATYAPYGLLLLMLLLFLLAYRKQTAYIVRRVDEGKSS